MFSTKADEKLQMTQVLVMNVSFYNFKLFVIVNFVDNKNLYVARRDIKQ